MIKKYEIMYIVDQDVKESELQDINKKMDAILTENGGKVIESKAWGLQDFAYKINHKKKGYYFVEIVETDAKNITEFERVAKIDKTIVRTLVINTEKDNEYIQTTELSKTDMSKFEEEHREKRGFKRPDRSYDTKREHHKADGPKSEVKEEKTEKASEEKAKPVKKTTTKKVEEKSAEKKPAKSKKVEK